MVGQREEVVAVLLVPVGDHLGEVVAVAPERVRVQVALPVLRARGGRQRGGDGLRAAGATCAGFWTATASANADSDSTTAASEREPEDMGDRWIETVDRQRLRRNAGR